MERMRKPEDHILNEEPKVREARIIRSAAQDLVSALENEDPESRVEGVVEVLSRFPEFPN